MAPQNPGARYKVRLTSGRLLGPLDLARIRALILAGQILGGEQAREHPVGDWRELGSFPDLAELLLANAMGKLADLEIESSPAQAQAVDLQAATQILPQSEPGVAEPASLQIEPQEAEASSHPIDEDPPEARTQMISLERAPPQGAEDADDDRTRISDPLEHLPPPEDSGPEPTIVREIEKPKFLDISNERTVVFQRSLSSSAHPGPAESRSKRAITKLIVLLIALALVADFALELQDRSKLDARARSGRIRPTLPVASDQRPDPAKSKDEYQRALEHYQLDTIPGYRKAVLGFHAALKHDPENVRALAFLASAYLNLIDVSNKDENYFNVISKLIQLSRTKSVDLPETVIADTEYLTVTGRPLAAQTRVIEYSKVQKNYNEIVKLYLAQALFERGELGEAARSLAALSPNAGMRAKAGYLRGRVAEGLGDPAAAIQEYQGVLKVSPKHGYARFRMVKLADFSGELKEVRQHLEFLTGSGEHLAPRDLAEAYFLRSKLDQQDGRVDLALGHIERALGLDPENADYNLNFFLLRAKQGDAIAAVRKEARLYYYMAESERLLREGKVEDAQIQLMEARREAPANPQPLVRLGNLFYQQKNDVANARISFRKAAELAPNDVRVWGRYIELLIQSYEWDEANRALARLSKLPVPQGSIDKAMGDWYARQGRHTEAQTFYQKALSRDSIDPSVYIALGKSYLETKRYEQAPFMFALAQRFDPGNTEAVLGTARAIQGVEGIDRAVSYLKDELQKGGPARVELVCGIADLLVQKGAWDEAQALIDQAKQSRPDMALPHKLEAQLLLAKPAPSKRGGEVAAKQRAADAYQSYLDRNPSDASVYYDRYRVLVDIAEYRAADDTLQKIYELYPKFPNLHYSKGLIYVRLANLKAAQAEFEQEIKNGNSSLSVLLALGGVHLEQKDYTKGLGYFVQAMQRAPQEAEPKNQAAYANYLLKRYDAAVALYREALKLDSGNPILYRRLGDTYQAMGDGGNARWSYQKYLEMEPDAPDRDQLLR